MKSIARGALGVGLGLLTGTAFTAAASVYLTDAAIDRKKSKLMAAGARLVTGGTGICALTPEVLDRIQKNAVLLHEAVTEEPEITARDGVRLHGHWAPADDPQRVIIAFHGWRSRYDFDYAIVSSFWKAQHCSVLYVDQRAHGQSEGDTICFGLKERFDCVDWAEFVCKKYAGSLPVYLAGVSLGGTTVLMAAGEKLPPAVKGVMADCGFVSPARIFNHIARDNMHLPYLLVRACVEARFRQKVHCGVNSYTTLAALQKTALPVLFFHGTGDRFVPVEETYANYNACAGPKRLFTAAGAGHVQSYLVDEAGYRQATLDFWQDFH